MRVEIGLSAAISYRLVVTRKRANPGERSSIIDQNQPATLMPMPVASFSVTPESPRR